MVLRVPPSSLSTLRVCAGLAYVIVALSLARCGRPSAAVHSAGARYDGDGRALGPLPGSARRPNLVLVVLDTLRADTAADASLMPTLARLRREGFSFEQAVTPSPWTLPALTSVLTGLMPSEHGVVDVRRPPEVAPALTTFAEVLANAGGYETAAFVGGSWHGLPSGFLSGFATGVNRFHLQGLDEQVGPWVRGRDRSKPFFLLLQSYEVHDPYGEANHPFPDRPRPPRPDLDLDALTQPWQTARAFFLDAEARSELTLRHRQGFMDTVVEYMNSGFARDPRPELAAELRAAYEGGAAWTDGLLDRALARLGEWGLMEDTLLVVLSDHGESFGAHGILGHGRQLYDELVHVPLLMKGPAPFAGGGTHPGVVSLLDVLPTFLDLAGLPPLDGVAGASLLPRLRASLPDPPAPSEERLYDSNARRPTEAVVRSVRSAAWKFIATYDETLGTVKEELYDLLLDPGETTSLDAEGEHALEAAHVDAAFCRAVERLRDGIWQSEAARTRTAGEARSDQRLHAWQRRVEASCPDPR